MTCFRHIFTLFYWLVGIIISTSLNLEDPFLFPFGPEHGDNFITKNDDDCSWAQSFVYNFYFGQTTQSWLYVCTNGVISFLSHFTSYIPSELDTTSIPLIAPFFSDVHTLDQFFDRMCNYPYSAGFIYETACYCFLSHFDQTFSIAFPSNQYIFDEVIRNKTVEWEQKTFHNSIFDVYYDDYLAKLVFGTQTTKYVNLANNIFIREMNLNDTILAQELIRGKISNFTVEWGYVATWYKVGPFPSRIDVFNSFQAAILCGVVDAVNRCFVLFDYFQLEWGWNPWQGETFARAGLADGNGYIYELPFSGTMEVRNLWAFSNFDQKLNPGLWIIEINQNPNDEEQRAPFFPMRETLSGNTDISNFCKGPISPSIARSDVNEYFSIPNCNLPDHDQVKMKIVGAERSRSYRATYYPQNRTIEAKVYWFFSEPALIQLVVDGQVLSGHFEVAFLGPQALHGVCEIGVKAIDERISSVELDLSTSASGSSEITASLVNRKPGTDLTVTHITMDKPIGDTRVNFPIDDEDFEGTIQFSDGTCFSIYITKVDQDSESETTEGFCSDWHEEESRNDYSNCERELARWYGCPREITGQSFLGVTGNDAFWAEREVNIGMNGWEFDVCCDNGTDPERRQKLHQTHFCKKDSCSYNYGTDFCIRSPRQACRANVSGEERSLLVSNQCCYSDGRLLNASDGPFKAGRMNMQINSMDNLGSHYWKDLYPYLKCCIESPLECATKFKPHRKTIIGNYVPRNLLINRGDPDIQTVDGKNYPFMGLGVFTMLQTHFEYQTIVQASMRRIGQGTVISGVAVKFNGSLLECHIDNNGVFQLAINGQLKDIGVAPQYIISNIQIKESDDMKTLQFRFLGNSLIVQVVIVNNFLNLMLSVPPTFRGNMSGLMGNFDGDPSNDYQAKNGTILDPDSDFLTVDKYFGRSWEVPQTERLFSVMKIIDKIENETQAGLPFDPFYDIVFPDEASRLHAEEICRNDTACIRDMSLVGDDNIATAFLAIEGDIREAEAINLIYRESEDLFFNEIVIVATDNQVLGETTTEPTAAVLDPTTPAPKPTSLAMESTTLNPKSTTFNLDRTFAGPELTTYAPKFTNRKSTTVVSELASIVPESSTMLPGSATPAQEVETPVHQASTFSLESRTVAKISSTTPGAPLDDADLETSQFNAPSTALLTQTLTSLVSKTSVPSENTKTLETITSTEGTSTTKIDIKEQNIDGVVPDENSASSITQKRLQNYLKTLLLTLLIVMHRVC